MGGGWWYLKGSFGLCVLKGFKIECSLKINKWLGVVASSLRDIITIKTGNYFEKKILPVVIWVCVFLVIIWGGRCMKQLSFKIPRTMKLYDKMYSTSEQPITDVTGAISSLELSFSSVSNMALEKLVTV